MNLVDIIKRIVFLWLSDRLDLNELVASILILYYFNGLTWNLDMTLCHWLSLINDKLRVKVEGFNG